MNTLHLYVVSKRWIMMFQFEFKFIKWVSLWIQTSLSELEANQGHSMIGMWKKCNLPYYVASHNASLSVYKTQEWIFIITGNENKANWKLIHITSRFYPFILRLLLIACIFSNIKYNCFNRMSGIHDGTPEWWHITNMASHFCNAHSLELD